MQRYNFRLRRVLDVKKVVQDVRRREMARAVRELESANNILHGMNKDMNAAQEFIVSKTRGTFTASELIVHYNYMGFLRVNMDWQMRKIGEATKVVQRANKRLIEAYREREAIARLEKRAKESYRESVLKEEQAAIDEVSNAAFFKEEEHQQ